MDGGRGSAAGGFDMLSASEWPGVPPAAVLLAPGQCRSMWRQFLSDSNFVVQQVGVRRIDLRKLKFKCSNAQTLGHLPATTELQSARVC